uniref:Uncharacterized protein n=1 Tax=Arundo donax TaxID=35708 RepID=A0A0A9BIA2_ARUDO
MQMLPNILLWNNVVSRFGVPNRIITDNRRDSLSLSIWSGSNASLLRLMWCFPELNHS